jgi:DNA-binding XRE family transcriptional regulator
MKNIKLNENKSIGRPSEYTPDRCSQVLGLAKEGLCKTVIAAALGITRKTLYKWAEENAEFKEALELAIEHSEAAFTEQVRAGMWDKTFNAQAAGLYGRNVHKWDAKTEPAPTTNIQTVNIMQLTDKQLDDRLKAFQQKYPLQALEVTDDKASDES